jgi:hypothetical protein
LPPVYPGKKQRQTLYLLVEQLTQMSFDKIARPFQTLASILP